MLKLKIRATLLAATCCMSVGAFARADETKHVDLPAGDLTTALESLATQAGVELIYETELVRGFRTGGAVGEMTVQEAVVKLLIGTPLTLKTDKSGAMLIAPHSSAPISAGKGNPTADTSTVGMMQLAWAEDSHQQESEAAAAIAERSGEDLEEIAANIPEVLVTATQLLNRDIKRSRDDIQPFVIFDRQLIEKSGTQNVGDFLKQRLTMATTNETPSQRPDPTGNVSRIRLRGLDADETLILIDGHRAAGFALSGVTQQADVNAIPLSAIERIEVLPATASAIHGGSATGGVINIVLRRDYSGLDVGLTYGNTFDSDAANRRVDLSAGLSFDDGKTRVLMAGMYDETEALQIGERDFVQRARERILRNDPASIFGPFPPLGSTTNIASAAFDPATFEPVPLTLEDGTPLNSLITFVPHGYAGSASDGGAAFVANAGRYNLELANTAQNAGGARQGLLNEPTVKSLMLTVRHELTHKVRTYLDLSGSQNASSFATNSASTFFFIPASAPNNPFQQDILVSTPGLGADESIETKLESHRAVAGVAIGLPGNWQGGFDYTWHRTTYSNSSPSGFGLDPDTFVSQADIDIATGAADVLRDINQFPIDFSQYLLPRSRVSPADTTLREAALQVAGPLFSLRGGPITLTARIEHREETLDDYFSRDPVFVGVTAIGFFPHRSQTTQSAYLEANAPIVSARNRMTGLESLELQVAARHDDYDVRTANDSNSLNPQPIVRTQLELSSTDPLFGVRYQPVDDLAIRASYGTGFLPPSYSQFATRADSIFTAFESSLFGITDPRRGGEALGDIVISGAGNDDLSPEESQTRSAGIILTPSALPGFRLGIDWTRIKKTDVIVFIGLGVTELGYETLIPNLVVRAPAIPGDPFGVGPIIGFNQIFFNVARQDIESYDFALDYSWQTEQLGSFAVTAMATHQVKNDTQLVATAPIVENVGFSSGLNWTGNVLLSWERGGWNTAWTTRYYDSYKVGFAGLNNDEIFVPRQGSSTIPSQLYHDFFAGYSFDLSSRSRTSSLLSGVEVQLGVRNVFDKKPPVDLAKVGALYSPWGDPRLASYYLTVRKSF